MVFQTSNCLILVPIALSLFVAVRLSLGSVDDARRSWSLRVVQGSIVLMLLLGIFALGVRAHVTALGWPVFLTIGAFILLLKRRRLERDAMLQMAMQLDSLEEQQAYVTYLCEQNVGWLGRRARELQRDLAAGISWFMALEMRGVALGVYERLAMRIRHHFGGRPKQESAPSEALSPLNVEMEAERLFGRLMALFWFITVGPLVVYIAWRIVPVFVEMFDEFGIEMTESMLLLIWLSDQLVNYFVLATGLFVWWMFMFFGIAVAVWFFPSVLQMPLFRWFTGSYYIGAGFLALSHTLKEEKSLTEAFDRCGQLVPVGFVAAKFRGVSERLRSGEGLTAAMHKSGAVAKREIELFTEDVIGVDWIRDPVWGLRELAAWKVERMLSRYSVLVQSGVLLVTVLTGLTVGLVGVAVISCLGELILALK